jgi:hypothetical protein
MRSHESLFEKCKSWLWQADHSENRAAPSLKEHGDYSWSLQRAANRDCSSQWESFRIKPELRWAQGVPDRTVRLYS